MAEKERPEPTEAEKAELQKAREKRIRTEVNRLRKMLRAGDIDEARLAGCTKLVGSAAFLAITLEDLQNEINREGCTDRYQNGENQWGTKQSPAVQSLSTLMQRYLAAMKQLVDLLPEGEKKPKGDELMDFIGDR